MKDILSLVFAVVAQILTTKKKTDQRDRAATAAAATATATAATAANGAASTVLPTSTSFVATTTDDAADPQDVYDWLLVNGEDFLKFLKTSANVFQRTETIRNFLISLEKIIDAFDDVEVN